MKRQRGRNRGGGGSGGGGGGKPQAQNANRAFDSNGPEGAKVRGNAQHVFEKYQQLARDASAAGDRVLGENYLQHAEHYFRLLRAMQPTRPASEILGRDHFSSGFDIDFEDEGAQAQSEAADAASAEAGETPETWQARESGGERPRDDGRPRDAQRDGQRDGQGQRDDRPRDDRPRDDRPRYENRDRNEGGGSPNRDGQARRDRPWRDERPRDDRPRDDRPRDERPRDERPRDDRPREDRPRYERDDRPRFERNRDDRPERDPLAVVEPQAQPPLVSAAVEPAPQRPERKTRVLRDAEGGESHAPAFLQAPAARADAEEAPRPRRRRAPRTDGPASSEGEEA
ncbi:MAG: hypothetical protein JWP23_776 [Phenylobacterium sp.]|nr:hypothetical protein [Phenylobacterium sp.]